MQQLLDRFVFRIGPTTVAFVKSTDDDRLWCAHTMRQSSFRRLCVQQKTKTAWCVPGLSAEPVPLQVHLVRRVSVTTQTKNKMGVLAPSHPHGSAAISLHFEKLYIYNHAS